MMKRTIVLISIVFALVSCKKTSNPAILISNAESQKKETKASTIINEAITAHGGELYNQAAYSFIFRNHKYRFINNKDQFSYSVNYNGKNDTLDIMTNETFERRINGTKVVLSSKEENKYRNKLNSVIYFATLPYKLKDSSVNTKFIETRTIKDLYYDVIEVTFNQEGGGEDYDDEFYYWINQETKKIDYLAYNYRVNNGGVRFRSAYNKRVIGGITFQDYINWKASVGTPLKELPSLYEQNKLTELSRIVTERVIPHKK